MKQTFFAKQLKKCPLCNSEDIIKQYTITRFKPELPIDRCLKCNFLFMNPRLKDSYLNELYSKNYYKGNTDFSYQDERKLIKYSNYVWNKRLQNIRKFVKTGNFLDVGAAFGGFMQAASKYYNAYGIELSKYAGLYAQKTFKEKLHIGTLSSQKFEKNFFNVITMIELIEHLENPCQALQKCFDLLKPGGLLLIQTANMNGHQARKLKDGYHYFLPGHLSYFTFSNLKMALRKTGFSKVIPYYPTDFGLLPKLLKSRHSFKNIFDYYKWFKIALYHFKSKIKYKGDPLTSSMVIYAIK
jgi:2-polyprenyl-3-methyl-5-hydroxy-6-metoxy-1,4-benzoquinol methylase